MIKSSRAGLVGEACSWCSLCFLRTKLGLWAVGESCMNTLVSGTWILERKGCCWEAPVKGFCLDDFQMPCF